MILNLNSIFVRMATRTTGTKLSVCLSCLFWQPIHHCLNSTAQIEEQVRSPAQPVRTINMTGRRIWLEILFNLVSMSCSSVFLKLTASNVRRPSSCVMPATWLGLAEDVVAALTVVAKNVRVNQAFRSRMQEASSRMETV
jgi:hypothetical protein